MNRDGHHVALLTAELTVFQRAEVIRRFRDGHEKVLIATNVCARGRAPGKAAPPNHAGSRRPLSTAFFFFPPSLLGFLNFLGSPGIDVQQVTVVLNFSLPMDGRKEPDFDTYLHRIGRTGRFGKKGVAFSMVEQQELRLVRKIEEHFRECLPASPGGSSPSPWH